MVAMEGENILHHVKGRGIVQEGEISGGICPGKYFQGGENVRGSRFNAPALLLVT